MSYCYDFDKDSYTVCHILGLQELALWFTVEAPRLLKLCLNPCQFQISLPNRAKLEKSLQMTYCFKITWLGLSFWRTLNSLWRLKTSYLESLNTFISKIFRILFDACKWLVCDNSLRISNSRSISWFQHENYTVLITKCVSLWPGRDICTFWYTIFDILEGMYIPI